MSRIILIDESGLKILHDIYVDVINFKRQIKGTETWSRGTN